MKEPKVSVAILNWNNYQDTLECLKSLKKINYKNFDIWILDNGSKNESVRQISNYIKNNKKINLIKIKENIGFAAGNNLLIKKILKNKCDFVLVLNDDVVLDKEFLRHLVNCIQENKNIAIASPKILLFKEPDKIQDGGSKKFNFLAFEKRNFQNAPEKKFPKDIYYTDITCACCWLVRKEIFKENSLDESFFSYSEDDDFCLRLRKKGWKIAVCPKSKIWHKRGGSTKLKKMKSFTIYFITRNSIWLRKKHGNFLENSVFYLKFFFIKFPKTVIYLAAKGHFRPLLSFFKAIYDGFLNL